MSTPTFAGKGEMTPTASCNSRRGSLLDEHIIAKSLFEGFRAP
jgi:hypothetical protein